MCLGTSDIAGEANEDAETQQGNTISSEVNFKANRSFSRAGFPEFPSLSFPLGFFSSGESVPNLCWSTYCIQSLR